MNLVIVRMSSISGERTTNTRSWKFLSNASCLMIEVSKDWCRRPGYKSSLMTLMKLGVDLLSDLERLESDQCRQLHNIGSLIIRILHNAHAMQMNITFFFALFFDYEYRSECLSQCILRHIESIDRPYLVRTVSLWLDIFSHYHCIIGNLSEKHKKHLN